MCCIVQSPRPPTPPLNALHMYVHTHNSHIILLHVLLHCPSPCSETDDYSVAVEREASVLVGVMEHLLPKIGPHVRTLDLAHGKAVSNEVVGHATSLVYCLPMYCAVLWFSKLIQLESFDVRPQIRCNYNFRCFVYYVTATTSTTWTCRTPEYLTLPSEGVFPTCLCN